MAARTMAEMIGPKPGIDKRHLSRVNYLVRLASIMMAGWCGRFFQHSDDVFCDSFHLRFQ
jgi:hypothetical protein